MIKSAKSAKKQVGTIADLRPDPRNARRHTPRNVGSIVDALHKVGAARSIVIDEDNTILAGNATVEAAGEAGIEKVQVVDADGETIIAVRRTGLTKKQKAQLAILDNRAAELAEWDLPNLTATIEEFGIDLPDIAFDEKEFAALSAGEPGEVVEDEPLTDAEVEPRCKPGDLWTLGEHRLLCGDSTKADDVARLMNGEKAKLCFTSPPYAQQRDYDAKQGAGDWDTLMRGVFANLPMTDDGQVLVNLGLVHRDSEWQPYWDGWIQWMREQGWRRFGWYVWDQGFGLPGDWQGRFAPSHEFVFHFNRVGAKPIKWVDKQPDSIASRSGHSILRKPSGEKQKMGNGDLSLQPTKIPDSVVRVLRVQGKVDGEFDHPAPYPVGLVASAMQSWAGDCFDPLLGSGTTIIAAEQLSRRCYGIEISPKYCDIVLARWEKFTGKKARREGEF